MLNNPEYRPLETGKIHNVFEIKNDFAGVSLNIKYSEEYGQCYEYLNPIPLTQEILLKCGFQLSGIVQQIGYFRLIYEDGGKLFFYSHPMLKIEVKFLHHLQNLYYSNTDQELNASGLIS